jgi:hypothetical protein
VSEDGESGDGGPAAPIENLDFVGELNGSSRPESTTESNSIDVTSNGVSFGENEVRTFETDSSERKNEYMTDDADADADDDDDSGRIKIGGDIKWNKL